MDLETRIREKPHVTKEDIKEGLYELGLRRGYDVGIHSSLSSFGYVVGRADTVIEGLLETVGPEGTVVFPTYSTNRKKLELSQIDVEAGITGKEVSLPYNPEEVSCWTGTIPDTFWRRKEAVRGPDPIGSLAAIGPKAKELSQSRTRLFSGWDRLLEADGYMLLLGVNLSCCSSMHLAERYVDRLPQYLSAAPQPSKVLKELMQKYEAQGIRVTVEYPGKLSYPHFERMEEPCREHGIMSTTIIGEATVKLLRLKELINLYAEYLRKDPDIFYHA